MIKVYLFDWGDTLMVDFEGNQGKMCDWKIVEAISGAKETLKVLSKSSKIYIATGAADSTELEIKRAFERVGLSQYITGYFCKDNVGFLKGEPEFFYTILNKLQIPAANVAMVGDNFDKDIKPAIDAGIQPVWFTINGQTMISDRVKVIKQLSELY